MERIKFYSKSDLGCSYNLEKLWGDMPRINIEGMLAK